MSFEQDIYQTLQNLAGGNVFPHRLPSDPVFPAITYMNVGGSTQPSQQSIGVRNPRTRVEVWARNYDDLITTSEAVLATLHGNRGSYSALFEGDQDVDDPDTGLFHRVLEFSIWYS